MSPLAITARPPTPPATPPSSAGRPAGQYLEDHNKPWPSAALLEQIPATRGSATRSCEIRLGNTDAATRYLDTLIGSHGQESLGRMVSQARGLDAQGNLQLVKALAQLTEQYPDQAPLWYARAVWKEHEGELQAALDADERAIKLMPRHEDALLLKAQLLFEMGETRDALRHMKKVVKKYPEARRPRITYVRLLLATGNIGDAEKQLAILSEQNPNDLDLKFSLALLALEAGATDTAIDQLDALLAENYVQTRSICIWAGPPNSK